MSSGSSSGELGGATERPHIGEFSLLALGVNGIVGVGIFFTPNLVAALAPGPAGAWVYLGTAVLLLPVALTVAMLGRALPRDGGPGVWARAAFGSRAAYAVGWIAAVSAILSTAAVLSGLATHVAAALGFSGRGPELLIGFGCMLALGAIAGSGLRPSAWTWDALTLLKLMPLALLVLLFVSAPLQAAAPAPRVAPVDYGRALLVALFPLQGFEAVPVLAGSAVRGRAIPFATLGALVIAAGLYAAVHLACVGALPDLSTREAPLVAAASVLGGEVAGRVVAIGTNVSALGVAFGMIVMTPRYLAVLGTKEGLGTWLGRVDERGVPRLALAATVVLCAALLSFENIQSLLVLSSSAVLVQYVTAAAALVRLGFAGQHGLTRVALVPAFLGLFTVGMLAQSIELRELWVLLAALLLGFIFWLLRARSARLVSS